MKQHPYIYNSRRRPYIGPAPTKVPQQVSIALAVVAGAFAAAYAVAWISMELKNLS